MVVRQKNLARQEHYSAWAFQRIFRRIAVYLFHPSFSACFVAAFGIVKLARTDILQIPIKEKPA